MTYIQNPIISNILAIAFLISVSAGVSAAPYTDAVKKSEPLVYFQFSEAADSDTFESFDKNFSARNTGAISGAAAPRSPEWKGFGKENTGIEFAKNDEVGYLTLDPGLQRQLHGSSGITLELWIQVGEDGGGDGAILFKSNVERSWAGIALGLRKDQILFQARSAEGDEISLLQVSFEKAGFKPDQWNYLVGTIDFENAEMILFVNDLEKAKTSANFLNTSYLPKFSDIASPDRLGADSPSGAKEQVQAFKGMLDEFAIYNRVLSHEEISTHYEAAKRGR